MLCSRQHVSVCVVVLDSIAGQDYCLFGYKLGKQPGWELPGGKHDPGETLEETAIREVYEETGLVVEPYFLGVYSETKDYLCLPFVGSPVNGSLDHREPDKHREWKWFPCNTLPSPLKGHAVKTLTAIGKLT